MTLSVSPQMRLVALLGGVAALGLAAFMFLGHSSPGSTQATLTPAERSAMHAKSKHKPRSTPAPKRVAPHKAISKPAPAKPARPAIAVLPGLPPDLARSLRRHELVVVSLYDPQARVDRISLAEASAGASVAHAGFVPLNVLDQRQAGPLMTQLGVLPDPAVLVYRRPGKLVARFDGFADRDTVAQAVINAVPSELARQAPAPAPQAPARGK